MYYSNYARLAACYAMLGKTSEAQSAVAETFRIKPDFTIRELLLQIPYKNAADSEDYVNGLRKAGLPE